MKPIGLIGGSGLYALPSLTVREEVRLSTPFGEPSDAFVLGELGDVPVAFLSRHGRGHRRAPSEVAFRANVWGFRKLGCDALLSASACGSMREEYRPGDVVLADQFVDRTRGREASFFGDGCVAHVSMAHPVCPRLLDVLEATARGDGVRVHRGGTYLCIEGPQFSTRAESLLYRSWGVDVIGMTNATEAKLCREAEVCYASMAMVTDYDCWNEEEQAVTVEAVLSVLAANAATANRVLAAAVLSVDGARDCTCRDALSTAVLTRREDVPEKTRERLALLLEKRWR